MLILSLIYAAGTTFSFIYLAFHWDSSKPGEKLPRRAVWPALLFGFLSLLLGAHHLGIWRVKQEAIKADAAHMCEWNTAYARIVFKWDVHYSSSWKNGGCMEYICRYCKVKESLIEDAISNCSARIYTLGDQQVEEESLPHLFI